MAMEKPVIASRVGGIPDIVKDGINGFLTPPGDTKELGDALKKLLNDKRLATRMGKEGRKGVTAEFSADVMVNAIKDVYKASLERKGIKLDV
jgi:glycosyltransferase involved in cell wall biosynthesis